MSIIRNTLIPFDSEEWADTDGDGIGDNADTDENDGYSDKTEMKEGTDLKDKLSFPVQ